MVLLIRIRLVFNYSTHAVEIFNGSDGVKIFNGPDLFLINFSLTLCLSLFLKLL
jgi:ABC-type branched-subunit amino acid transport system permease subunit